LRRTFRWFQLVFSEVDPKTLDDWEAGFRADAHPWREIAVWEWMADAFEKYTRHLTGGDAVTPEKKRDVLRALLAVAGANSWPAVRATAGSGTVTAARLRVMYDDWTSVGTRARVARAAEAYHRLIEPTAAP
jgi:hypothetical protein